MMRRSIFHLLSILILFFIVPRASAQAPNTINTIAGGGTQPSSAKSAYLPQPYAAVGDTAGNTYIAVPGLNTVYKVDSSGAMTIFAGTGIAGFSGDGGPATQAQLSFPTGLAIDTHNNFFIADTNNNRIRRVDTTGTITTVAGSEDPFNGSFGGDNGPATNARLNGPQGVAVGKNDDLFIADTFNGAVRRVDGATQIITTIAGGGPTFGCPSGPGSGAGFVNPVGIAADGSGNVFVSDMNLEIVCKITSSGQLSSYAGQLNNPATPGAPNGDGGPAFVGLLLSPTGLSTDASNNLYITDSGDPKIRIVDAATQHINTFAGDGFICGTGPAAAQEPGCGDSGAATSASFDFPRGVFVNSNGSVLVADTNNMRVRLIAAGANPIISALAGGGFGGDGGPATSAIFGIAQTLAVDSNENIFALETSGDRLRKIAAAAPNDITTVAGTGVGGPTQGPAPLNGDGGPATSARFVRPIAVAMDSQGNFYIADRNYVTVRVINNQTTAIIVAGVTIQPGQIQTIAGNGRQCGTPGNPNAFPGCGDGGAATSASLSFPTGVAADENGNVYISDAGLNTVRVVNASGTIRTFAGTPGTPCTTYPTNCGDGGAPTSALLNLPFDVVTAPSIQFTGAIDVFIADSGDNVIRKVDGELGTISTVAFNGLPSFGGDGGSALLASMSFPQQIAVDELENVYVSGGNDNVVRRVGAFDQLVFTAAGDVHNLGGGFSGDGGPSTQAQLQNFGVALGKNAQGTHDLFIVDSGSNRIRKVDLAPVTAASPPSGFTMTFPNTLAGQTSPPQFVSVTNTGLDDAILSNVNLTNSNFQLVNSCNPITLNSQPVSVGPPFGSCILTLIFAPPAGATGTLIDTLSFTTNDPAKPSYALTLMGTVTAPVTLTVSVNPSSPNAGGNVTGIPGGSPLLNCPATNCVSSYATGDSVTLVAIPNPGFAFSTWDTTGATGASCPGPVPICVVPMTKAQSIVANFVPGTGPGNATITVTGLGNGSGTITSSPTGISCTITAGVAGATGCSAQFPIGKQVILTPAIAGNSSFAGWLGVLCSTANVGNCTIPAVTSFTVGAAFSGPAQPFTKGQVFLSTDDGMVFVYNPDGSISQVLNSGTRGGRGTGMAFDTTGNLFLVNNGANLVEKYTGPGSNFSLFGTGFTSPYSVALDPLNNVFVGQMVAGQGNRLLEFAGEANGAPTTTFFPAYESDSTLVNWFDLLSNDDTILYTLGTNTVKEFDLGEQVQHPDLETNLTAAYALRVLPDGTVLVANTFNILRLDSNTGNTLQTYTIPGTSALFQNLNLDPDGQTFWTVDQTTGKLYRLNLASGAVVPPSPFATGLGLNTTLLTEGVGGIAVLGTPPSGAQFTLTVTDAGTGSGTVTSQAGLIPAINCTTGSSTGCAANYNSGTSVTLTATPATGSTLAGWSGACTNATGTCTVTMSQVQNVTATFNTIAGPTLQSIAVTPGAVVSAVGTTAQFTATGTFSDGSQQNLTSTATWASSNTGVATVNSAPSANPGQAAVVGAGGTVISATQSGISSNNTGGSAALATPFSGSFQPGQLFVSDGFGLVDVFTKTGTYVGALNTQDVTDTGMAFDKTGNLYVTTFDTAGVVKFDPAGKLLGRFGSGYSGFPESIVFSQAGNAIIGAAQGNGSSTCPPPPALPAAVPVFEFDAGGTPISTFQVTSECRGSDWVELLKDQTTLLYTSEGKLVKSFNISTNTQNPDFASNLPGSFAFALRELPDGDILVADSTVALLLNGANGAIKTTYTPSGAPSSIFALNLDPDGTSFWTADLLTGTVYKFDIASGNQLLSFTSPSGFATGLAIFGEKPPGQNNITIAGAGSGAGTVTSNPAGIDCGVGGAAGTVCTAPFTDNTSVTLTAAPSAGSTFGGFSANCTAPNPQTNPPTCTVALGTADVSVTTTFTPQATHFVVSAPATATAGMAFSFTVTAQDASNQTVTTYAGTVHFTSTDGAAVLLANSTLTNGVGTFSATLNTTGGQTLTATDTVTASITGTSGTITVSSAAATHFTVSAPASATAGTAFNFTVTALTASNATATGYTGTVHFTSSDGEAVLPANSMLTNGVGTFSATLNTVGGQTITATDTVTSSITGVSGAITVSSAVGPATHFVVSAPATATAGTAFNFTVTAKDASNNTATGYTGTVHFTSTDDAAVLPANSTLTNGVGTFSATLNTNGGQTITATDTKTASITGVSGTITVSSSPVIITVAPPPPGQPAVPIINPGGAAVYGLVLTSQPGFSGTVTLSCTSSAPQFITCAPDPASVTITPGGTTQVAIVLNTFCSRNAPLDMPVPGGPAGVLIAALTALALASVTWMYRRRPRWVLTFAALVIATYSVVGCGSTPAGPAGRTPAGNYQLSLSFKVNGGPQIPGPVLQLIVK